MKQVLINKMHYARDKTAEESEKYLKTYYGKMFIKKRLKSYLSSEIADISH